MQRGSRSPCGLVQVTGAPWKKWAIVLQNTEGRRPLARDVAGCDLEGSKSSRQPRRATAMRA